jgi:hypothetical protein
VYLLPKPLPNTTKHSPRSIGVSTIDTPTARGIVEAEFDRGYAEIWIGSDDDDESPSVSCVYLPQISVELTLFIKSPIQKSSNLFDDLLACSSSAPLNEELRSELAEYLSTGPENVKDPLLWWVEMRAVYPRLSRMARNYLSIPGTFFTHSHIVPLTKMICFLTSHFHGCRTRLQQRAPCSFAHP